MLKLFPSKRDSHPVQGRQARKPAAAMRDFFSRQFSETSLVRRLLKRDSSSKFQRLLNQAENAKGPKRVTALLQLHERRYSDARIYQKALFDGAASDKVHETAARILGEVGDTSAVPLIKARFSNGVPLNVKLSCAQALEQLGASSETVTSFLAEAEKAETFEKAVVAQD